VYVFLAYGPNRHDSFQTMYLIGARDNRFRNEQRNNQNSRQSSGMILYVDLLLCGWIS